MKYTKRQKNEILRAQLDNERSSFLSHWRDLNDFILPRRGRFLVHDTNKGERRNQKIIDSTATTAARTLRSGMMGGVTSPARPWFRLTTPDPGLADYGPVKDWLFIVTQRMQSMFAKSNIYNKLPIIYGDIGVFGTGALSIEEDMDSGIYCQAYPIGSYYIANNQKYKVDVFMREFRMTVRQLVERFGQKKENGEPDWTNFSLQVRNMWDRAQYEEWVDVCHVIQPNPDWNPKALHSKFKKYHSCYYEKGTSGLASNYISPSDDLFLSEGGFDFFPVLCPRWETTGEDVYGTDCPGMIALGDIKQLQLGEKRAAQAIEKMVNPPMTGPTSLRNQKATILPGDITYLDVREGQQGFRAAHDISLRLNELENKQAQVRERVRKAFFEDLFLMLANTNRRQITAREIDERHEEKLLALGPVLEQLNQDLLDPMIDNAFTILARQNAIPPPPEELQGMDLKVDYMSIMSQAQKLVGISGVERFTQFTGNLISMNPSSIDKIDYDQMIDIYGDMTSVPPGIVRADDAVQEIRGQRAQAQAQQAQADQAAQQVQSAKALSETKMTDDSALKRLMDLSNAGT